MKIGFDGRFIQQYQTGDGVFSQLLLEGLARIDMDNEYTVYLLEDNPFIRKDNFHLKRMPAIHANSHLRFLLSFPWELGRNPVDLFHAIHTVPLNAPERVVLHLVEFGWITNPDEFPASRIFLAQLRPLIHHSVRRASRIITATQLWKNKLLDYFDLSDEKVHVIPHGFNERFLERSGPGEITRIKQKHGITENYILNAGNLHPRKNIIRLIEAFNWLKETKGISLQLVLAGKALYQADEIYRKASSCSSRDSIIFTGYVPFEELRALYHGASLFAFPSLEEGFGLPVHEAMASRLPVVVSNRGALPEVAGDAALVVDPLSMEDIGSAINRVLDDAGLREELIEKGLKQIQGYSWAGSCRKLLDLYNSLRAEGTGRG
jgi:glycosyltransferase involved in cell wall biosynthesis